MLELFVFVVALAFFIYRRIRKQPRYVPAAARHVMEPVSSSMLLSEVDPTKSAQVNIVSLLIFEEKMSFIDFRDRFVRNLVQTDPDSRMIYRLDCSHVTKSATWIKMENWDPKENCFHITAPQTLRSANELVAQRLTGALSIDKPLWELQFIETYQGGHGMPVSAAIITMHHAMGDGFTLCHQIMRRAAPVDPSLTMHDCYPFSAPATGAKSSSIRSKITLVYKIIKAVFKLLLLTPDPPSALRNTSTRRAEDTIVSAMDIMAASVDNLKSVAKKADLALHKLGRVHGKVSLNDVIVAACSLALGNLMKGRRHDVTSAIWIGLNRKSVIERPKERRFDWGNENLGTCYLQLPTGETNPIKALELCHLRMGEMKHSPEPVVANRLLRVLGSIPLWILWPIRNLVLDKMSASISNFPGPLHQIKFPVAPDGAPNESIKGIGRLRDVFFLVAPPFSYGPYVTIMSYRGKMYFGMCATEKLMDQSTVENVVKTDIPAALDNIERAIDQLLS